MEEDRLIVIFNCHFLERNDVAIVKRLIFALLRSIAKSIASPKILKCKFVALNDDKAYTRNSTTHVSGSLFARFQKLDVKFADSIGDSLSSLYDQVLPPSSQSHHSTENANYHSDVKLLKLLENLASESHDSGLSLLLCVDPDKSTSNASELGSFIESCHHVFSHKRSSHVKGFRWVLSDRFSSPLQKLREDSSNVDVLRNWTAVTESLLNALNVSISGLDNFTTEVLHFELRRTLVGISADNVSSCKSRVNRLSKANSLQYARSSSDTRTSEFSEGDVMLNCESSDFGSEQDKPRTSRDALSRGERLVSLLRSSTSSNVSECSQKARTESGRRERGSTHNWQFYAKSEQCELLDFADESALLSHVQSQLGPLPAKVTRFGMLQMRTAVFQITHFHRQRREGCASVCAEAVGGGGGVHGVLFRRVLELPCLQTVRNGDTQEEFPSQKRVVACFELWRHLRSLKHSHSDASDICDDLSFIEAKSQSATSVPPPSTDQDTANSSEDQQNWNHFITDVFPSWYSEICPLLLSEFFTLCRMDCPSLSGITTTSPFRLVSENDSDAESDDDLLFDSTVLNASVSQSDPFDSSRASLNESSTSEFDRSTNGSAARNYNRKRSFKLSQKLLSLEDPRLKQLQRQENSTSKQNPKKQGQKRPLPISPKQHFSAAHLSAKTSKAIGEKSHVAKVNFNLEKLAISDKDNQRNQPKKRNLVEVGGTGSSAKETGKAPHSHKRVTPGKENKLQKGSKRLITKKVLETPHVKQKRSSTNDPVASMETRLIRETPLSKMPRADNVNMKSALVPPNSRRLTKQNSFYRQKSISLSNVTNTGATNQKVPETKMSREKTNDVKPNDIQISPFSLVFSQNVDGALVITRTPAKRARFSPDSINNTPLGGFSHTLTTPNRKEVQFICDVDMLSVAERTNLPADGNNAENSHLTRSQFKVTQHNGNLTSEKKRVKKSLLFGDENCTLDSKGSPVKFRAQSSFNRDESSQSFNFFPGENSMDLISNYFTEQPQNEKFKIHTPEKDLSSILQSFYKSPKLRLTPNLARKKLVLTVPNSTSQPEGSAGKTPTQLANSTSAFSGLWSPVVSKVRSSGAVVNNKLSKQCLNELMSKPLLTTSPFNAAASPA